MPKKKARWLLLDNLKALIVAFMITGHTLIWWYSDNSDRVMSVVDNQYYEPLLALFFMVINALVMSLPLTAGMALFFSLKSRAKIATKHFFTWLITRAAIIFLIGLLVNYLAWGSRYVFTWDVLQFYALSFLLLGLVFRYTNCLVGIALGGLSVLMSQYPEWGTSLHYYGQIILWGDPSGDHYWPLFPWLSIVVVGYLLSYIYNKAPELFSRKTFITGLALTGASLLLRDSWYKIDLNNVWGAQVFMPDLSTILMQLGLALLLLSGLEKLQSERSRKAVSVTQSYSHGILVIYMANIILGYHLTVFLSNTVPSLTGLWTAVFLQLFFAYLLGVTFIRLKLKLRRTKN